MLQRTNVLIALCRWLSVLCDVAMQKYALDFTTLAAIEIAVFAVLEYKRYEGWKKTGQVPANPSLAHHRPTPHVVLPRAPLTS
jgi:hypothetical protein